MQKIKLYIGLSIISIYVIIGVFNPLLLNTYPYSIEIDGQTYYPAWHDFLEKKMNIAWKNPAAKVLKTADPISQTTIPFRSNYIDIENIPAKPPGAFQTSSNIKHVLGTDLFGRDVLANIIDGTWTTLLLGVTAVCITLFLGIFLGLVTGFFGNEELRSNLYALIPACLFFILGFIIIYTTSPNSGKQNTLWYACTIIIVVMLYRIIAYFSPWKVFIKIPIDSFFNRFLELYKSVPKILIILILVMILPDQGPVQLGIWIGIIFWPAVFRIARAATIELRYSNLYYSLKNIGLTNIAILTRHFAPNLIRPIMVSSIYAFASIIIFEATLSFLGMGLPSQTPSWGQLIAQINADYRAWWVVIFPGLAILIFTIALHLIAQYFSETKYST